VRRRFFLFGSVIMLKCTAAWVSVENQVDRGNAGPWKAWKNDETVSPPFPPPLEIAAAISHIPTASTTTGYILQSPAGQEIRGLRGTVNFRFANGAELTVLVCRIGGV
jgi:hypothetical protein